MTLTLSVPVMPGDGTGPEIWEATRRVIDFAVARAYGSSRKLDWHEIPHGKDAVDALLPSKVAIKGPVDRPRDGGTPSFMSTLRGPLGLSVCAQFARQWKGIVPAVRSPGHRDLLVYRETTEEIHGARLWRAGTDEARRFRDLCTDVGAPVADDAAIELRPTSALATQRVMRMALQRAIDQGLPSVTLVRSGGTSLKQGDAFSAFCLELVLREFPGAVVREEELGETTARKAAGGRVVLQERTLEAALQQVLLRPGDHRIVVAACEAGGLISDLALTMVGGPGFGARAHLGDHRALFDVTHGPAPRQAGQESASPISLILAGTMLLEHIGWEEAAGSILRALEKTTAAGFVPLDLERVAERPSGLRTSQFASCVIERMS